MASDPVRAIADAVLYEGYILWPYRRSAMKNQQRWTFGSVFPEAHSRGRDDDACTMQTQCLLQEAQDGASVRVNVRFLHVVRRDVGRAGPDDGDGDGLESVDELTVAGERHLAWDEAVEREIRVGPLALSEGGETDRTPVAIPAGREEEPLRDAAGRRAGALVRSWCALQGSVQTRVERLGPGLHRLTVVIANTTPWDGGPRAQAQRRAFCSTHTVLRATGASFVSLTDPPAELAAAARDCDNVGTWPVLVGEPGERHTLLCTPIILEDHPRIAPESPGDLFDGGEIDQLLILSILSMTDEERAEMRDTDPRAREILERTESLSQEQLMQLHGAIRELSVVRR